MIIENHTCPNGHIGDLWLSPDAKKPTVTCPYCKTVEDVSYYLPTRLKTREELERAEYERLKKEYGK